ncbi:cobyrinate a,c-diamide synthase [Thiohalobacter sp. IOR34]|uniref:cobyrinate a,c-diamide synthase n=1 Tax=Thiohalobacter sp. IOR34 TaxID=3057176 RepID=UPI0025B0694B|nr:cobyrinate a,c-diamide synthase [Thiohalobacter sp. IOR34]WJW74353.1 cobyrinate a,c-diamide synthase [Thiohalobacter sp. IOR34]
MSRLLIAAAHKSSGKTTLSIGLCAALHARGQRVQAFKKGPDYIDPMWLGRASGQPCYNLDFYTQGREEILASVARRAAQADITLIEANKGLYDGMALDGSDSNAALARLLETPVVLVIDTRGMTRGIAPLLLGYQGFDPRLRLAGVILNQVGGARHEGKLREAVEHYTDLRVLGAVRRDARLNIDERHLGLIPSNEADQADRVVREIGEIIGAQVELEALGEIAASAPALPAPAPQEAQAGRSGAPLRIAIARDAAFGFYYPDDLEALERGGAELLPFDTLSDSQLPEAIDGLFIGGGFPESRLSELEANVALRQAIRQAIEAGLPTYAECGGLMYLARSIRWQERRAAMVGVIPGDILMCERPQGRGYIRIRETAAAPWPREPGAPAEIAAHEFHYSRLENLAPGGNFAYEVLRGSGIDGRHDGYIRHNLLACYAHLRDTAGCHWTRRFLAFVRQCNFRNKRTADAGARLT